MRVGREAAPILAVLALVGGLASAGSSAAPSRSWQTVVTTKAQGVFMLGWASGRVWFIVDGVGDNMTIWSAHVGSHGLTSLVPTSEGTNEWIPNSFIEGSNLVNCCAPQQGQQPVSSSIAPLLASGKVGSWSPLPGGPEKITQDALTPPGMSAPGRWAAGAGLTSGGRTVWAIGGALCPNSGPHQCTINYNGISSFALCCTPANAPVDLTSRLTAREKAGATGVQMGTDAHGRAWLAWLDGASSKPGASLKLVQFDPTTLAPLSQKTIDHVLFYDTVGSGIAPFVFTCGDSCRLVYQGLTGAASWDGFTAPTMLWVNNRLKDRGGHLIAAGYIGGKLAVGSWSDKVANVPDDGQRLTAALGDGAGRNLRTTGSIEIPHQLPDGPTHYFLPMGLPAATITPNGLVAVALYNNDRRRLQSRVLATVLPG